MRKVVIYARTSASDSSLEHQLHALEQSLKPGERMVGSYVDRASGGSPPPRPGLQEALDHILQGNVDSLRLARSPEALQGIANFLGDRGVALTLITDPQEV
jgi:DNA invertase Pin-like site-specific DNA recombinase